MPLLKKKKFEKAPLPELLRDDEEVFYCSITKEIFRDYEEFSERMFLCNSMVWTCSMTGKNNLTYAEALESEQNAKKSIKEFPTELKVPMLYLATKTKRSAFADMAEDVFAFAKDRYFIGENVETCFTGNEWKDSHILQVIAPTEEQIKNAPKNGAVPPATGGANERNFRIPSSLYKYQIEHLDAYDKDISEIMIADRTQIRRKKTRFSKEKCKLFLKQFIEQDERGVFVVKPSVIQNLGLDKITFDKIFDGPLPDFETSKKFTAVVNGSKKTKQESLHKYLSKNGGNNNHSGGGKNNLLEQMRKREEEFKLLKQQKKEEEMALRQKKREENLMLSELVKNWYKPKEDLELEDQKKLPEFTAVQSRVQDKYLGEMLMVMEFVNSFSKLVSAKDFFPGGLKFDIMERALVENEVAGPFTDLIQMLLSALFNVQEEEASQYRTQVEKPTTTTTKPLDLPHNLREATRLATTASNWSTVHQGVQLSRLPLYPLTVSEILRLHLLGSGARINETGANWRYASRGGYTSEDDPGLYLRLHHPNILKALAVHNVVELAIADKLKIVSCLIDQLLTYADVRDIVEERREEIRQTKNDLKTFQLTERKREQDYNAAKMKLKKELKNNPSLERELQKLEIATGRKKLDNEYNIALLQKGSYKYQVHLGQDRAYRNYLLLESVPGMFVNCEEENPGICLNVMTEQKSEFVNATRDDILTYLKGQMEKTNNNNTNNNEKENEAEPKSPAKLNGLRNTPISLETCIDLMLCTSNPETCKVHSIAFNTARWSFLAKPEEVDELINGLNKRGMREGELYSNVENMQEMLLQAIEDCPVNGLNEKIEHVERKKKKGSGKSKYDDPNLGFPADTSIDDILHNTLIENILEMEEKLHAGSLGTLLIKDREKWRDSLQNKNYKDFDTTINQRENPQVKKEKDESSRPNTPTTEPTANGIEPTLQPYVDPGNYLGNSLNDSGDSGVDNSELLSQSEEVNEAIKCLAIAVVQLAYSVEPKYLKKPLGRADVSSKDKKKFVEIFDKWEQSLLASTSFSQIFLHYSTLDSCIMWTRSILLARCRICRRVKDSENMLLCDECNLGHHLYCLKPPLKSVPVGDWFCNKCETERKKKEVKVEPVPQKKRRIFRDEDLEEEEESNEESEEKDDTSEDEEEDDSDDEPLSKILLCKTCGSGGELITCEKCLCNYHIECTDPPLRRPPRGSWFCTNCKNKRSAENSDDDEVINKRPSRRDEVRGDLPLHNAALQELLSEIMKDSNAWPFLRPVQKNEVPDYYEVITKPMDFGTIKYKLNMGEYKEDAELMSDVTLVFENCNTYNRTDDDVYKCGVELLKIFQKKCKELGLKLPEDLIESEEDDQGEHSKKKRRMR